LENRVVVVAGLDIGEEVGGAIGRLLGIEFDGDGAEIGGELDHGVSSCEVIWLPAAA
jgi:hypothetical protein